MVDDVSASESTGAEPPVDSAADRPAVSQFQRQLACVIGESLGGAIELLGASVPIPGSVPVDHRVEEFLQKWSIEVLDPDWKLFQVLTVTAALQKTPKVFRGEGDMMA